MIKIKDFELKSELNEFTLFELDTITKILNDDKLDYIDKYLSIFELLNMPEDILDNLSNDELFDTIKNFIADRNVNNNLTKEIEIDGYIYKAYDGDEFILKAKDVAKIENLTKQSGYFSFLEAIAVIFKREDLSKTEHYEPAHIKYKMKLFKDIDASLVYPYLIYITEKLSKKIEILYDNDRTDA